jgi:hypothetical protein
MNSRILTYFLALSFAQINRAEDYDSVSKEWASAINGNQSEKLKALSKKHDINRALAGHREPWTGITPLGYAASRLNAEAVIILLENGALKDGLDEDGFRAIDRLNQNLRYPGTDEEAFRKTKSALAKEGDPSEDDALVFVIETLLRSALGDRRVSEIAINGKDPIPKFARSFERILAKGSEGELSVAWNFNPSRVDFRISASFNFLDGFSLTGSLVPDSGYWIVESIVSAES